MAEAVVDPLEVVDVEHQHAGPAVAFLGRGGELLLQVLAARGAGEDVDLRRPGELGGQRLGLGQRGLQALGVAALGADVDADAVDDQAAVVQPARLGPVQEPAVDPVEAAHPVLVLDRVALAQALVAEHEELEVVGVDPLAPDLVELGARRQRAAEDQLPARGRRTGSSRPPSSSPTRV